MGYEKRQKAYVKNHVLELTDIYWWYTIIYLSIAEEVESDGSIPKGVY